MSFEIIFEKKRKSGDKDAERPRKRAAEEDNVLSGLPMKAELDYHGGDAVGGNVTLKVGPWDDWANSHQALVEKALEIVDSTNNWPDQPHVKYDTARARNLLHRHGEVDVKSFISKQDAEEWGDDGEEIGWNAQISYKTVTQETVMEMLDRIFYDILEGAAAGAGTCYEDDDEGKPEMEAGSLKKKVRQIFQSGSVDMNSIRSAKYEVEHRHTDYGYQESTASVHWVMKDGTKVEILGKFDFRGL
ncbi:MAG: hypothetical protein SGARI_006391 [Bacillariaceae sp.]